MNVEATQALNDVSAIDTVHISGRSTPWIPFTPVNNKILLKPNFLLATVGKPLMGLARYR